VAGFNKTRVSYRWLVLEQHLPGGFKAKGVKRVVKMLRLLFYQDNQMFIRIHLRLFQFTYPGLLLLSEQPTPQSRA